ncbi:hydroxymethylbilane synthase [Pseudoblastomonas halimionae]|uniref:Porphobilinogen deaminase n=1 Tax=Alteriqipengyuania halimionae TaxID=1926630 RepID=A0A6I4TYD0_9SPHN|nr:hydroxymethylbilane synthase [Alteriqipengyuania halimionae]MXP08660.1 hydroxymethylbilane synthase [Alteriqipengyuania halimionae]
MTASTEQPFRLGTRRSPLALVQANAARDALIAAHGWDPDAVELVEVVASGDRIKDRPLAEIGGKALWTKELDAQLLAGEIDAAVHSAKDVETLRPDAIHIAATLERADVRDVLVGVSTIAALPQGARIGTSAPRRAAQMLHARPDCSVVTFRGNVATRLARLAAGEADATLLAAAGLARLGETHVGTPLASEDFLPAPAQGIIAIECRRDDERARTALAAIDHRATHEQLLAERAFLEGLGGSCSSPIAVLTTRDGDAWHMRAAIFSPDGALRRDGETQFSADDLEPVRAMARSLLNDAPEAIAAHFDGPPV